MGVCLDCIVAKTDGNGNAVLKTSKISNRDDMLHKSALDNEENMQNYNTNSLISKPQTLKESFFPFPQEINLKAKEAIYMFCPLAKKRITIKINESGVLNCICTNSNIDENQIKVFMDKFALNHFNNHKCDIHKTEGEYCSTCNCWICPLCKTDYHNKLYGAYHHLLFFKTK